MDTAAWLGIVLVAVGLGVALGLLVARRNRPMDAHVVVPQRARALLRSLPHAVMVVGVDGRLHYSNDKGRELGVALSTGMVTAPLRDLASRAVTRGETTEAVTTVRRRHALVDNQLLAVATPVEDESLAVISVFDAGSHAAARNAHREFVVNVSHELKTPIGALGLMAEALTSAADSPEVVRDFAAKIEREAQRMGTLVEQFIELSRVQSTETVIDGKPQDLAACVADAVDGVRALAEARKVGITVTDFPRTIVSCERRTMAMAIRNLLENAVRYSPENSRVTVSARHVKDAVELSVKDQGIGISPLDLSRIFDRFYRADEARDRETGGTGIGLAIVKHVARQHGGRVQVWSEPSVGSTFTLVLPLLPPES